MSSSGIDAISSGPLIIRTYNNSGSSDKTFVLTDYDYPVSSNFVLITSSGGSLAPSNNIYVSTISNYSSITQYTTASTSYVSTVYSINSTITFQNEVVIGPNPYGGPSLVVDGTTVFSEPGAQSTPQISGVNIFGLPNGNPIVSTITTTTIIDINQPISKINFQLIGSGGQSSFSNPIISNEDLPGYGAYISGTLAVKQGDKLKFFIGTVGDASNSSKGTSLLYLSSVTGGIYVSTLVCVAGAGGGNGFSPTTISTSSGGGHGGGGNGTVTTNGNDYIAAGYKGYDGISSINGNIQSLPDGGEGGQTTIGGQGGNGFPSTVATNGNYGGTPDLTNLFLNGGLIGGGEGGNGGQKGGWGGGGYSGGGGGGASQYTSGGGGGGATYIAISTLVNYLSNVVCLSGQWISQNDATPFGGDYGKANNPGFASITGYQPNDTLYTNGDIECRVLRYEMLDPPINAIGGSAALWSLYPSIDIVHMNDNPIVECGGIEIDKGGIDVANFINIRAGANDSDAPGGFMSKFIRTASSGTQTIDYQVAGDSTEFGDRTWQDARYVYNSQDAKYSLRPVWGIVTSSNITPVGSTIGDIHFYNNVYIDGNVGIGVPPVSATEQLTVWSTILVRGQENSTSRLILGPSPATNNYDYCSMIEAVNYESTHFSSDLRFYTHGEPKTEGMPTERMRLDQFGNVGIGTTTPTTNLQVIGTVSTNNFVTSSIFTNSASLNISSAETSTLGNLTVTGTLNSIDIPPVGAINMYAGAADPPGWFICDGRTLQVNDYTALYTVIGTSFGTTSFGVNFLIPDMRNRFPVGVGAYVMGQTGGVSSISLSVAQLPSHSHGVNDPGHSHIATHNLQQNNTDPPNNTKISYEYDDPGDPSPMVITIAPNTTGITIQNTGSGLPFDNRPPFFGINYIIKY